MLKSKYISHKLANQLIQYFNINGCVYCYHGDDCVYCYHGDDIAYIFKNGYDYNLSFRYMGQNVLMTFNKTKAGDTSYSDYEIAKASAGIRPNEGRVTI